MYSRKDRTSVIVSLVAVLAVMAVAYAAFSSSLTISSSASIDSTWKVGFDTSKTTAYTVTNGIGNTTKPNTTASTSNTDVTMSITETQATLSAKLYQPGDKVVYTLTVKNDGTLKAGLSLGTISGSGCTVSGKTCTSTSGNIKFTVTDPAKNTLAAKNGSSVDTTTLTVTAEFVNRTVNSLTSSESASITIPLNAQQVK